MGKNMRRMLAVVVLAMLMGPVTGSLVIKSEPVGWHPLDAFSVHRFPSNGL